MNVDVFVDTNGFIHFKDLKDRPWRDVFPGVKRVDLVVASCVVRELDHHKGSTNDRRRNRARLALDQIDEASKLPEFALTLKKKPVEVRLVVSTVAIDWSATPNLDSAKPDDQLVAEARSYNPAAVVFSNDTGPRIRARIIGLKAEKPPDLWVLDPEKTDDQRQIVKLEAELKAALSTRPKIVAHFEGFEDGEASFAFEAPVLRELRNAEVEAIAREYLPTIRRLYALERNSDPINFLRESRTTFEDYERKLKQYLTKLHGAVSRHQRIGAMELIVKNASSIAAQKLRVAVKVTGAYLIADVNYRRKALKPPERPHGRFLAETRRTLAPYIEHARGEDPLEFNWINRPGEYDHEGVYQAQEFRATERRSLTELIYGPADLPTSGTFKVEISGTNLPEPVLASAAFTMVETTGAWSDARIVALLDKDLVDIMVRLGIT